MDYRDDPREVESFLERIRRLDAHEIIVIGSLDEQIVAVWSSEIEHNRQIVLTGRQRQHYLVRHPETFELERFIRSTVLSPDEVHKNDYDQDMAIFYRRISGDHYIRVAALMQRSVGWRKHSILSYRLARDQEVRQRRSRRVWRRR